MYNCQLKKKLDYYYYIIYYHIDPCVYSYSCSNYYHYTFFNSRNLTIIIQLYKYYNIQSSHGYYIHNCVIKYVVHPYIYNLYI